MAITKEQLLNHLYYNKLPQIYRDMDMTLKTYPLKRYLSSLIEGGYCEALEDIENILTLVDPEKCPKEYLPYLCNSFGLEYFEDIDELYQRKFLLNIGEIIKRRGTYSCVKYLIRALTGLEVDLSYKRGYNEDKYGRWLYAELQGVSIEQILQIETSIDVIERYVSTQIPYYITILLSASVALQILQVKNNTGFAMGQGISAKLLPFKSQSERLNSSQYLGGAISTSIDGIIAPFNVENRKECRSLLYHKQALVQSNSYLILPFRTEVKYVTVKYFRICVCSGSTQNLISSSI